ncbi:MAG TPA: hypothetical protein DCR44_03380 [Acholeplasmatales bacterium]|nr:MAG: hypothetical protein A2Y16_01015 [Tenericutes bacterium GWF2_57_13]HAQ56431.1 hypothetical protein [Acholeplasmatales bacterium]
MENQTLDRLGRKEIGKRQAYRALFPKPLKERGPKRAHFIKLRIRIPESKGVTNFLAFLFWLPLPILFARMILGFVKLDTKDMPLDKQEIIKLIAVRGIKVEVKTTDGVRVYIKTI